MLAIWFGLWIQCISESPLLWMFNNFCIHQLFHFSSRIFDGIFHCMKCSHVHMKLWWNSHKCLEIFNIYYQMHNFVHGFYTFFHIKIQIDVRWLIFFLTCFMICQILVYLFNAFHRKSHIKMVRFFFNCSNLIVFIINVLDHPRIACHYRYMRVAVVVVLFPGVLVLVFPVANFSITYTTLLSKQLQKIYNKN